jgi:prolyl oligopeptidase
MSFGENDEVIFKEWDRETKQFVEGGFESKNTKGEWVGGKLTDGLWIDENNILRKVVLDRKDVSEAGYPNTLYLWQRGTPLEQAKKILEIPSFYQVITFSRLLAYATHPTLFYI